MSGTTDLARDFVEAAAVVVRRRTGLVFSEARRATFEAGLATTIRQVPGKDPASYLARLADQPGLLDELVATITVGETYFFRDAGQFGWLRDEILPTLLATGQGNRSLRIWSAGCASGEEPYSLAILLSRLGPQRPAHILGTDISRTSLARARSARYSRWSLRETPGDIERGYFMPTGKDFTLLPAVRNAVEFRYLNLVEDRYPSIATGVWGMDVILCRNVLIYLDPQSVALVAGRLMASLGEDGWLLLGASDPPLCDLVPCDVVVTRAGLAYRRPGIGSVSPAVGRPATLFQLATPIEVYQAPPAIAEPPPVSAPEIAARPVETECIDTGMRFYADCDYDRAEVIAKALIARDDGDSAAWVLLVRSLANRGDLAAADRTCSAGLDRHQASAELHYLHAVLLAEAGLHLESAGAARRALYLDRGLIVAHLALGSALAKLDDATGAGRAMGNAQRLLAALAPEEIVAASDGETAGRLAEMTRVHLQLLRGEAS